MKIIYDSYREERTYHSFTCVVNLIYLGLCYWYGVAQGGMTLYWMWLLGSVFFLTGAVQDVVKFLRTNKETYAEQRDSSGPDR